MSVWVWLFPLGGLVVFVVSWIAALVVAIVSTKRHPNTKPSPASMLLVWILILLGACAFFFSIGAAIVAVSNP